MERFRTTKSINGNINRRSTRNTRIISNDNLKVNWDMDNHRESTGSEQHCMRVWVKEEIDLDPVDQSNVDGIPIDNDGMKDCHEVGESATSNSITDQKVFSDVHSREFVPPDNAAIVNEISEINSLKIQLECSNARNLELEKIVKAQKSEIKKLKRQQTKCVTCGQRAIKNMDKNKGGTFEINDGDMKKCPTCRKDLKTIKRIQDRNRHLKTCRNGSIFKCPYCSSTYSREYELRNHVQTCAMSK